MTSYGRTTRSSKHRMAGGEGGGRGYGGGEGRRCGVLLSSFSRTNYSRLLMETDTTQVTRRTADLCQNATAVCEM